MNARVLAGAEGVARAVASLRAGEVVGLPTETVYGLAGDAFQPLAMARIFEAKGRPLTDPLIVHVLEESWLQRVAFFNSPIQQECIKKIAKTFWPGPLTLILKKNQKIPDLVTAGMNHVAVRVPAHPMFREVLRGLDSPLAAPSANRFGRISPTCAEDVRFELGDKIPMILDGGKCRHGMESTIIAVTEQEIEILRPGPIDGDQLKEFGHVITPSSLVNTPGSLPGHYAPRTRLQIMKSDIKSFVPTLDFSVAGLMALRTPSRELAGKFATLEILSRSGDLREAAANFYGALRRLDSSKLDIIYAEALPEEGIGVAVMDRLRRAEYGSGYLVSPKTGFQP